MLAACQGVLEEFKNTDPGMQAHLGSWSVTEEKSRGAAAATGCAAHNDTEPPSREQILRHLSDFKTSLFQTLGGKNEDENDLSLA